MAVDSEPAKLLLPYLQRADELQSHEPLVSYYCRLYAMERGLKIPQSDRTKTTNSLLVSLMKQLEKDKKSLKLGPDDHLHLEGFAMNVFAKADKQDRSGRADINTAKTFYAASIFFEILNQFGEMQPDLEQKQKYALWKAADIRKALKEGRTPVPGPPGGDDDFSASESTSRANDSQSSKPAEDINLGLNSNQSSSPRYKHEMDTPPSLKFPPEPPSSAYSAHGSHDAPHLTDRTENASYSQQYHQPSYPQDPLPQHHISQNNYPSHENPYPNFQSYPSFSDSSLTAAPPNYTSYNQGSDASYSRQPTHYNPSSGNGNASESATASLKTYHYDSNYQPSAENIAEAHKAARFAVGALAFDDVSVAVEHLRKSLELLTNPSAGQ